MSNLDIKTFKKTFQFICEQCGEFAHTETEYCEICGTKTLRKATKEDYAKYEREKMRETKETRAVFLEAQKVEKAEIKIEKAVGKEADKAKKAAEKLEIKADKAEEKAKRKVE